MITVAGFNPRDVALSVMFPFFPFDWSIARQSPFNALRSLALKEA